MTQKEKETEKERWRRKNHTKIGKKVPIRDKGGDTAERDDEKCFSGMDSCSHKNILSPSLCQILCDHLCVHKL